MDCGVHGYIEAGLPGAHYADVVYGWRPWLSYYASTQGAHLQCVRAPARSCRSESDGVGLSFGTAGGHTYLQGAQVFVYWHVLHVEEEELLSSYTMRQEVRFSDVALHSLRRAIRRSERPLGKREADRAG